MDRWGTRVDRWGGQGARVDKVGWTGGVDRWGTRVDRARVDRALTRVDRALGWTAH